MSLTPVNKIPGGYYLKARKIEESAIAHAAPVVREVWDWLLRQCNHKDNLSLNIKRGQCVRRLADMQEGLHWFIGYRKMMYTKTQCEGACEWLREHGMITTAKTTRGMLITVCNYDSYQSPKNYEDNNEDLMKTTRRQQAGDTINKNGNNDKNEKTIAAAKEFYKSQVDANLSHPLVEQYRTMAYYLLGKNDHKKPYLNILQMQQPYTFLFAAQGAHFYGCITG